MADEPPYQKITRLAKSLDLKNLKLSINNNDISQWEMNIILWNFLHHVFTCTVPDSDKYWLESTEPIVRYLTMKSANPYFMHPRYFKSSFDIVNDFCLNNNSASSQAIRYRKMAMFLRTHFRMLNSNNVYDMHNRQYFTSNINPRGYVLPSKHIMTKELHSTLETLERMDQTVKSHLEVHSIRVGKLSALVNTVSMDRLVMNDILYWLENWVQRYDLVENSESEVAAVSMSDKFRQAVMKSMTQEEKLRWVKVFKTLSKWFSYGSPHLVTENVMDALQRTNDEQMMESIRIHKEMDRLKEMRSYYDIPEEEKEDLDQALNVLKKDKSALEYRFGELDSIINKNRSEVLTPSVSLTTTSVPAEPNNTTAKTKTITIYPNAFPEDLKKFSGMELVNKERNIVKLKNTKYFLLTSLTGIEIKGVDYKSQIQRLSHWIREFANDPFFFQSISGYVDDIKMFGLVMERVKCTLEMRINPDFFKKYTSVFERKKKFSISKAEGLMICYRLLKGLQILHGKGIRLFDMIHSKNILLKRDNGVWIGKWMIHDIPREIKKENTIAIEKTKYVGETDLDSFKVIVHDVLELVGFKEQEQERRQVGEIQDLVGLEMWLNILRRKYI